MNKAINNFDEKHTVFAYHNLTIYYETGIMNNYRPEIHTHVWSFQLTIYSLFKDQR